jgi:Zn-dependent peptidase ImmA (M78 family)/DNA-binding XRE family transcriptional regulator
MDTNILTSIDPQILGAELKRARRQRKLRQEDAAQIIEVARTTITAIESGERRIRPDELIKLARAYGRSVADFVRPRPTFEPFTRVQFRGATTPSEQEQETTEVAISLMEDLCRDYLELEEIVQQPLIRSYPPEYARTGAALEVEAEALAQAERSRLGLGDGSLPLLRDVLEQDVGIRIFYLPLELWRLSAMYYYSDQLGACMLVNGPHPEARCRWSLAHEYCHFLVDRRRPTLAFDEGYRRIPENERFADAFARHFLMPTGKIAQRFSAMKREGPIRTRDLLAFANRYGVSLQALMLRLEDLGLLKPGAWDRMDGSNFKIIEAQRELGLEEVPGRRDLFPLHYRRLALEAYQEGKSSEGRFARFLRVDRLTARESVGELVAMEKNSHGGDEGASVPAPGGDLIDE